ncbi:hypothetical protein N825_33785 [Skermanella stibiiresistens SB22]|uniref:Integrase n=1 Tax=Skermanella stibiiresistens SB22 TaxID=1385369 RepID=W9H3Y2_9PROT|nr:hypothetical protein [Skermanella stibiiresistens]EWY40905.1 hypothetical protein N825_33785 [Skermanella stibiiresistens SB22]
MSPSLPDPLLPEHLIDRLSEFFTRAERHLAWLPAGPATVAAYIDAMGLSRKAAAIRRYLASIAAWHAAARIQKNTAGRAADDVATRHTRLPAEWRDRRDACGTLGDAIDRFLKITDSYRPGLFQYPRGPGLPVRGSVPLACPPRDRAFRRERNPAVYRLPHCANVD